jgi:hypothetical protein
MFSSYLIQMGNRTYDHVRVASIWNIDTQYQFDVYSDILWYFAGGVFGGHKDRLIEFSDLTKRKIIETIVSRRKIMWETNIWYMVYNDCKSILSLYYGTHDSTIVQNY